MTALPPISSKGRSRATPQGVQAHASSASPPNGSMSTFGQSPKRGGATPAPGVVLRAAVDLVSTRHFTTSDERRRLCLDRRYRTGRTIGDTPEPFAAGSRGMAPASHKAKTPQPPTPTGDLERLGTADDTVARRGVPPGNPFAVVDTGGARSGPSEIDFSSDRSYRFYRLECADPVRILAAYSKRQEHVQRQRDDTANAERKRARQMMRAASKLEQDALRNRELAGQIDAMLTEAVRDKDTVSSRESSRGPPSQQRQRSRSIAAVSKTGLRRQSTVPPKAAGAGAGEAGTPVSKTLTVVVPPSRENMGTRGSSSCGSTRMAASTTSASHCVAGNRSILRDSRRRRSGSVVSTAAAVDLKPKPKPRPAPRPISPSNFMPDWRERLHRKLNPNRLPTPEPQETRSRRTVPVFVPDETILTVIRRFAIVDEMAGGSLHGRDIAAFHAFHGWPLSPSAHAALKQGHTEAFNVSAYLQLALPQLGRKWQVARACAELKRLVAEYLELVNAHALERQASVVSKASSSGNPGAHGSPASERTDGVSGDAISATSSPGRRKSVAPARTVDGSRRGTTAGNAASTAKPAATSSKVDNGPSPRGSPELPPLSAASILLLSMVPLDTAIDAMIAPGEATPSDSAAVPTTTTPGSLGGTLGKTARFALDTPLRPPTLAPAEMAAIAHIREGLSTGRWVQRCAKLLPDGRDTLRRMHLEYQRLRGSKNIGGIPWKPFRRAFQRLMGEDDLLAYFRRADRDGDGCLNFHEFVEAIWSGYAEGAAVPHRDVGDL